MFDKLKYSWILKKLLLWVNWTIHYFKANHSGHFVKEQE